MIQVSRKIKAVPITAPAFEPFGWLPVEDTDPSDGSRRLEFEWGDPHLNVISHSPQEVTRAEGGLRCEQMFRHLTHTQALLVLDSDSVIAVARASLDFSVSTDVTEIRAFLLRPLDAFVLHRGTWHWGPFPLGEETVHLYNVQGFGYRHDNDRVELNEYGLVVSASDGR